MPTVKLREFEGSRDPEVYREWRREVELIRIVYALPEGQLGPVVYLRSGAGENKPRGLLSHLEVKDLTSKTGLSEVLRVLDAEYAPEAHETADASFKKYKSCVCWSSSLYAWNCKGRGSEVRYDPSLIHRVYAQRTTTSLNCAKGC